MSGFNRRILGKTGLEVSPLGIGGGSGMSSEDLLYAFDKGINYFFFSSDLHHARYQHSAAALRQLCQAGSAVRDQVVLATVTYVNDPEKILASLLDQFTELRMEYVDVFHWGWITDKSDCNSLFSESQKLKQPDIFAKSLIEMLLRAKEVNETLVKRGLVRFAGASFHSRQAARLSIPELDVLMLRYNIAHTGVEKDVFPYLTGNRELDPGIVVFNSTHEGMITFDTPPPGYPVGGRIPTPTDCYRLALTNPAVDLVLTGLTNRNEVDQAMAAMEKGPLSPEECQFMRDYGQLYFPKSRPRNPTPVPIKAAVA